MRTTSVMSIPAGKCTMRGCDNDVPDGKLHCMDCRVGRYPESRGKGDSRAKASAADLIKVPESTIRLEVRRWYELHGAFVVDTEQNREDTRVTAGMSDLVVLWPQRGIRFVELKSAKGRQRESQRAFQRAVEAAGGRYLLARSVDDVIAYENNL